MARARDSLARRLTILNVLVSAVAVVLACFAFLAYEVNSFRLNIVDDLSIQSQIIGSNSASTLIFNDKASAEKTLSALEASPHVTFAGIYQPNGQFFAGYWRDRKGQGPIPPAATGLKGEIHWFANWSANLERPIILDGKDIGTVYITSDLRGLINRAGTYATILIAILALSLVAALLLSNIAQKKISQPVIQLADAARQISRDRNYSLRVTPTDNDDEIGLLIGSFNQMLSEIQLRDTTLQESERQFRTLADSLPQQAWIAGPDGIIVWFNQRWYDYSGMSDALSLSEGYVRIVDPAALPAVMKRWRHSVETGQQFEMVVALRASDGAYREFLILAMPVRDNTGRIVRWFGTNTDVTEQRRSEEALRRTEKLAATGRLAASIAHEINNPLEALTNLVYLARKNPEKSEAYLAIADQELDHIAEITKHTLGFYRDTATAARVNVGQVLHEVLELYRRKIEFKNISVNVRYGKDINIPGYAGELRQVFANLIANAIEAMEQNGHLTIKATAVHSGPGSNAGGVRVSLMDDGCGIDPQQMKKIFEPFYTTKKDTGTGLGLWLTQNLVQKHNGHIQVRSSVEPGKSWTVFSVSLPTEPTAPSNPSPEASSDSTVTSA